MMENESQKVEILNGSNQKDCNVVKRQVGYKALYIYIYITLQVKNIKRTRNEIMKVNFDISPKSLKLHKN